MHSIEGSPGAQFHPNLKLPKEAFVMSKGADPEMDSYSAFQATDSSGTPLLNLLKVLGVTEIYVAGLATDDCVKYSVLDALKEGLKVFMLTDAIAGVNRQPEDSSIALEEVVSNGAKHPKIYLDKSHFYESKIV